MRNSGMTEDVWYKNAKDAMSDMRMYEIMTYERKKESGECLCGSQIMYLVYEQ